MLNHVALTSKSLADYRHIVGGRLIDEIHALAEPLAGARVLHLNATAFGGGVAEILHTLVPLMRDVGIDAEWHIMHGSDAFYDATKQMHNALQGDERGVSAAQWAAWEQYNQLTADNMATGWDACVVHDPQPAAVMQMAPDAARAWLWRCHIDLSTPEPDTLARLLPFVSGYPDALFHLPGFAPCGMSGRVHAVPPAIDPLAPKNIALSNVDARFVCAQLGVDVARPMLLQVSRFDPWKDPEGVIAAYQLAKRSVPEVQLVLAGSMAADDPEGWTFYEALREHAAGDRDLHVLNNFDGVGPIEINALQTCAAVVIQKSLREGFGLTVTEALWKGRPCVAGDAGGITLQVEPGVSGYLVGSVEECAARCVDVLEEPDLGHALGLRGKEHVRSEFLTPRYLRDYLRLVGCALGVTPAAGLPATSVAA